MMMYKIPTYVINLEHRADRRAHIRTEFADKSEFDVKILKASENENGAIGLWQSICRIITEVKDQNQPYVLICEDDHQFTSDYSCEYLQKSILECDEEDGDILLGSVSWFDSALPVSDCLHWVGRFTGTQFMIIYRRMYDRILIADFVMGNNADSKIAMLSTAKYFLSKPISKQVNFGYSDVTARNSLEGRLEQLFDTSLKGIQMLKTVADYYESETIPDSGEMSKVNHTNVFLPIYAFIEEEGDRQIIADKFLDKPEFKLTFIHSANSYENFNVTLWNGIRRVIETAKENDEDVLIFCTKDHSFTDDYSKEYLFRNIIEAHYQGADMLLTGCRSFHRAFPVAPSRYWIAGGYAAPFIVIYKKFYDVLLEEPFREHVHPQTFIMEVTFNKMLLYPFISMPEEDTFLYLNSCRKLTELKAASYRYYWKTPLQSSH